MLAKAAHAGGWDPAPLIAMLESGQIPIVLLGSEMSEAPTQYQDTAFWHPDVRRAIRENFVPAPDAPRRPGVWVYIHRGAVAHTSKSN